MQCCSRIIGCQTTRSLRVMFAGSARIADVPASLRSLQRQRAPQFSRFLTSDVIPPPTFEGEEKQYPAKIQKLVDEITELTLVEVADLNELLKKTLKLPDVPAMSFSAMPAGKSSAAPDDEEDAPAKQEKSSFTVRLVKFDDAKKVAVIKEIKSLVEGMNLVQAKKFVESVPQVVRSDISKEDAEKLKETLTAAGGTVEIE